MANLRGLAGSGIDRQTGRALIGWPHVAQSLEVIFTTPFGERIMREWFGSDVTALLGRNMNQREVLSFWTSVWTAIDTFEPRYKVTKLTPLEASRLGHLSIAIEGVYRPRAHLGDFEPEGKRKVKFVVGEDRRLEAVPE